MKKENVDNRSQESQVTGDVQNNSGNNQNRQGNTIKNPDDWTTGDEPMTGAQQSYLNTLASEAGENFNEQLSKAEASKKIEELQQQTGRGQDNSNNS